VKPSDLRVTLAVLLLFAAGGRPLRRGIERLGDRPRDAAGHAEAPVDEVDLVRRREDDAGGSARFDEFQQGMHERARVEDDAGAQRKGARERRQVGTAQANEQRAASTLRASVEEAIDRRTESLERGAKIVRLGR